MNLDAYIKSFPKNDRTKLRKLIAEEVGVSESTVKAWANGIRKPRARNVKTIITAPSLDGAVSASELRPDVFCEENA